MIERVLVRRGEYHDSVTLMQASRDAESRDGVERAAAVAATPLNLEFVAEQGFELPGDDLSADDLLISIRADDEGAVDAAIAAIDERLSTRRDERPGPERVAPRSFRSAARRDPELSLAFVSVPGRAAAYEVASALEGNLNVFCFSDGVPVDQEADLKQRAAELGLLLMGADCGTAIVDGVALGFANVVRPGPVGIVGASGTGIQEVSCLLDAAGSGISHAIGVGGRDLSEEVGGVMTLRALRMLGDDDATEVVVVISKPPDARVAKEVAEVAAELGSPVILCYLGDVGEASAGDAVEVTSSLEDAASRAASRVGKVLTIDEPAASRGGSPGAIRGLFCGGTMCYEAMSVVSRAVGPVTSNIPLYDDWRLDDLDRTEGHTFIDFGEDQLTQGRAHPMIDPTLRNERFEAEAADPDVGVVILDVVLGHGAHPDPASDLAPPIERALDYGHGRLTVVASLCGTKGDPQGLSEQARRLRDAGALVTRSAASAGRIALTASGAREENR